MNRCEVCPTNSDGRYYSRPILTTGPEGNDGGLGQCDYLLLGAGPGKTEAKTGTPYSGLAGDELTSLYLPLAGLKRENVAIGNATLCWDGTDRTPPVKRVLGCAREHLGELLERVQPVVVVLMGGVTQALCDKRIRLDVHHGIPQYTTLLGGLWKGYVFPSYEPALGMRDTMMMTPLMEDFKRLGEWMRGEWTPPQSNEEEAHYTIVDTNLQSCGIDYLCLVKDIVACDTESHGDKLWSIQLSYCPGSVILIRADDWLAMEYFRDWAKHTDATWVFHNAPHDLDELRKIGVNATRFRDTMQESYALCALPQGLKALVYRLFGHEMKSWEDVVWPASVAKVKEWLEEGVELSKSRQIETKTLLKMGKCLMCGKRNKAAICNKCGGFVDFEKVEYSSHPLESILAHILRHVGATEENEKPYDPWKMLPKMQVDGLRGKVASAVDWVWLNSMIGEMPVLGIGNVPEDEAVAYACADADYTLRLARKLEELRDDKRWKVDEADWDE